MDGKAPPVEVKPEDNLEYLQQEVKLEIKTEIDLPLKSEFDEGLQCYQQQTSQKPLPPFPPIKEELDESLANALVVLSQIAEDGEIEVRVSVG
uniref:Uncharacterized protein n=1 Tax=Timema poppense TaxID=170557 RepID=A0A7R9HCL3_TIMPO|nr:unnamed protein product [Timema poppensis]